MRDRRRNPTTGERDDAPVDSSHLAGRRAQRVAPPPAAGPEPDTAFTEPLRRTPARRPAPLAPTPDLTTPARQAEPAAPHTRDSDSVAEAAAAAGKADPDLDGPKRPIWRDFGRNLPRLIWRTIVKAWDDGIVGWSAQAAFWQALSLPPLLLGLLGSIGWVSGWFGPDTVDVIYDRIIAFANRTFSESVVNDLIRPTVDNVLSRGRVGVVSIGFVLSLWAGSSAMSCFVASIVRAHDQHELRNPVWQRIFALFVYIAFLLVAIFLLPLVALGPTYLQRIVPESWDPIVNHLIDFGYFPFVAILLILVLTTLYRLALPHPLPWHRLIAGAMLAGVVFWVASYILRIYLTVVTREGYTYGALATPIAFLLFTFFLGFALVLGAEFNAAVQSLWPAKQAPTTQVRGWVSAQTSDITDQLKTLPDRLASGPIRRRPPDDATDPARRRPGSPRPRP